MLFLYEFLFISLIARSVRTPRVEIISTLKCAAPGARSGLRECERAAGAGGGHVRGRKYEPAFTSKYSTLIFLIFSDFSVAIWQMFNELGWNLC